jgi:hypothetical protein
VTVITWGGTHTPNDPTDPLNWIGGVSPVDLDDVVFTAAPIGPIGRIGIPGVLNSLTVNTGATLGSSFIATSVVNAGTITGFGPGAFGVEIVPASGTVTNSGTITGDVFGVGVLIRAGGTVTNGANGVIEGGLEGIRNNIATATIVNNGTIRATAAGGIGVLFSNGPDVFNNTLVNSGAIIGDAADAVQFGAGDDTLKLLPGASFTGVVDGAGGTDTLQLTTGTGAGTLNGIGSTFTNFETLLCASGAWILTGIANDGLGTIAIAGFNAFDTIDLTGFNAVSGAFANNVLTLTDAINAHATLHIQGNFAASSFSLSGDGAGGTNISLAAPPGSVRSHGAHTEYLIADDSGLMVVDDTVGGRDGDRTRPGSDDVLFADGTGVFDPTGTAGTVSRLYQAALNRAPDLPGLKAWTNIIDTNQLSLAAVANSFANAPEFIHNYGSLSNDGFVRTLYQNALGRPADAGGEQAWDDALTSGLTRGQVALGFAQSPENRARTLSVAGDKNDAEAYRLYQAALARTPDQAGLLGWSAVLASGATPSQVAQGFIDSAEFQQKYAGLDTNAFVSALYQNALHRPPDDAGLHAWVGALQQGVSKADVVVGFSDSLENRLQTASATHDSWVFIPA